MRKAVAISFGSFVLAAFSNAALACSCPRNPTPEGILAASTAVFTGTVRAVQTIAPGQSVTTFVVTESFKGAQPGATINVHHASGPTAACGVTFNYGASHTLAASLQRGALWTSHCSTWMFLPHEGLSGGLITRMRTLRGRQ